MEQDKLIPLQDISFIPQDGNGLQDISSETTKWLHRYYI
jgi:hypothetical protein